MKKANTLKVFVIHTPCQQIVGEYTTYTYPYSAVCLRCEKEGRVFLRRHVKTLKGLPEFVALNAVTIAKLPVFRDAPFSHVCKRCGGEKFLGVDYCASCRKRM